MPVDYKILTPPTADLGEILESQCIGDSLSKINNNFLKLDNTCDALQTTATGLSSAIRTTNQTLSVLNPVDTATVDLTWTPSTRSIQADVKNNSIDYTKVASGMVLNCVNTFYNEASSYPSSANNDVEINALNTTITPKLVTSKILIQIMLNGEAHHDAVFRLKRDIGGTVTELGTAVTAGSRNTGIAPMGYDVDNATTMSNHFIQFYDSTPGPQTTSPVTYKLYYRADANSRPFSLNRTTNDTNNTGNERVSSSMNLLEIKG